MLREQHRFFLSVLVTADTALLTSAAVGAYFARFEWLAGLWPPLETGFSYRTHALPVWAAVPITMGAMAWAGLYQPRRDHRFYREAWLLFKAVLIALVLILAMTAFFRKLLFDGRDLSRLQILLYGGLSGGGLLAWRYGFRTSLRVLRRRGWNLRHVAIVGTGRLGQVVCHTLRRNSWTGIHPTFFISHHATTSREQCLDLPVLGGLNDLEQVLDEQEVSGVFLAMPGRMTAALPDVLTRLSRHSLDVRVVPDMNPRFMPLNMAAGELDGMPILSVRESPIATGWGRVAKRGLDVLGAIAGLLVFALPMAMIAVAVRLGGRGPIMFRQERMSLNGQHFKIYKFRTMQHVAGEAKALDEVGRGRDAWTRRDDPRITRVGRLLRRTSLDELPQLLNVLLGEMSLVGPRPERPELIEKFREDWRGYMLRQNVKAGMTGWAQVNGLRGDTDLKKRLQYDLFYVRNWSIGFDLRILWMTIFRGFAHPNAH
ncbi:MAG: undecaprenyl-phosphate glucose phosphotransferase [Planctomycetota bacterium]|jgi:Undecaprenyl-phosphate glucose phosphotransferase